jgi:hypothetical protein
MTEKNKARESLLADVHIIFNEKPGTGSKVNHEETHTQDAVKNKLSPLKGRGGP